MKNIEVQTTGIQCDSCDYVDTTIKDEDFEKWLNQPCPKCGENLLTQQDLDNFKAVQVAVEILDKLLDGLPENNEGDQTKAFSFSVDTHKTITISEIKEDTDEDK